MQSDRNSVPQKAPFWVIALVIGSAMSGMHIFVPALPLIAADFNAAPAVAKQTVGLYMLALAAGQVVYGPLSDWFGRKPVLLAGVVVYTLTAVAATVAMSMEMLLVARVLQGAGGCAGLVLGRAIVHDTAGDRDAASTISHLNTVLLISPALAPMIGLWLAETWGWRVIPAALAVAGALGVWGVVRRMPETSQRNARTVREMGADYLALLRFGPFLAYVVAGALCTTTMFALLTSAPFLFTERLGRPVHEIGVLYTVLIVGILVGNFSIGRLLGRFGFERLMIAACVIGIFGAAIILSQGLAAAPRLGWFMLGGMLYTTMSGMMAPLALTRSVDLAPRLKGTASGLYGFSQMTIGATAIAIAGLGGDMFLLVGALTLVSAAAGLATFLALKRWRERGGKAMD